MQNDITWKTFSFC